MTKAKTTGRTSPEAAQLKTDATTTEAKAKRQRGTAVPADETGANAVTVGAPTKSQTAVLSKDAIPSATLKPPRQTKAALLRAMLVEPGGVSLAALIKAAGWQAHALRAYLSGLRKEGLTLTRRRDGENTIYAIDPSGSAAGRRGGEWAEKVTPSKTWPAATPEDGDAVAAEAPPASLVAKINA